MLELADFAEDPGSTPSIHMVADMSVTPVPGNLWPSSDLPRHQVCRWYTHIHAGQKIHTLKSNKLKKYITHYSIFIIEELFKFVYFSIISIVYSGHV